jgi:phosphate transport system protein
MGESRRVLRRDEQAAREQIINMGATVERAIVRALQAFRARDPDTAREVVAGDAAINQLQRSIEQGCFATIALQQPVARDLRDLVSDIQIAAELERIGDHAADIGKIALLGDDCPPADVADVLQRLGEQCRDMLCQVLAAYRDRDERAARAAAAADEGVDRVARQITADLLRCLGETPADVERTTHALWVAHNLERIADRVTNIAERVVFMATGEYVDLNG